MKLGRLDYCLSVEDTKTSYEFYSNLDFHIVEGNLDENWIVMEHGNLRLGLYQDESPGTTLNFRGADIREVASLIKKLEISPEQSKYFDDGTGSITIKDPNGYVIFFDTHETELKLGKEYKFDFDQIYQAKPSIMLGRTDLCLDVSNLQESVEFYENLGLVRLEGNMDDKWIILSQGNLRLALFEADETAITINFRGGDVKSIYDILMEKQIQFEKPPMEEDDGSVGMTLYDPDGNFIYFNTASDETI
jgi:catechol 2,3-dioxygenase-like lactoylglutathione lyase family enzyme